jgi:hypothetical protein
MIKKALFALGFAAVASTATYAAAPKDISLSQDKKLVLVAPHAGAKFTPAYQHPGKPAIYSNLATKYPKGLYFGGEGYTLCGPDCGIGESIAVGGGFTPSANATATEVDVAVGYIEGTDSITLAIYSDSNGVPGKALWSGVTKNLPTFGECCGVAKGKIKGGLALTGGTPYWVVVYTDKKETSTFAAWNIATTDQIDAAPEAYNDNGTGWNGTTTTLPPAFAVY